MNVWVVRAEFGKHADAFRNGGYVALDFDISEPYVVMLWEIWRAALAQLYAAGGIFL